MISCIIDEWRERKRAGFSTHLVRSWNSFVTSILPSSSESSSSSSLPLADGDTHSVPSILLISLFLSLVALILLVAQQLGLLQKCRSSATNSKAKDKGAHAS